MTKIGKKLMEWDTCNIAEEVEYILTDFDLEWEYLTEYLTEVLERKNKGVYWKAVVSNFGWRSLDGEVYLCTETGEDLLCKLLPNTDCTFRIYNYGNGIAIQNFHHDSPMGNEWYYITPIKQSTYEKYN